MFCATFTNASISIDSRGAESTANEILLSVLWDLTNLCVEDVEKKTQTRVERTKSYTLVLASSVVWHSLTKR